MANFIRFRVLRSLLNTIKPVKMNKRLISQKQLVEEIFPPSLKRRPGYLTREAWLMGIIPGGALLAHLFIEIEEIRIKERTTDLSHRSVDEPVQLPLDYPEETNDMEYYKSIVKGRFEHEKEIYIENRVKKSPILVIPEGFRWMYNEFDYQEPEPIGYHVVTPFVLESGEKILVNRGWIDEKHLEPKTRLSGQVSGNCDVSGLIRKSESKSWMSKLTRAESKIDGKIWNRRDVEAMANELGTLPIMIELCKESYVEGGPVPGQTLLDNEWGEDVFQSMWWQSSIFFASTFFLWFMKYVKTIRIFQYMR